MISAVILAGGASRRMGRPKALLPFPKRPLLVEQWLALRAAVVDPLRVVVGARAPAIIRGSGLSCETFVVNARHALGPMSSLQVGIAALLEDPTWAALLVQPVDALPPFAGLV